MENFVVNLFSDQLSKIILNFHDAKLKINANFLSGKGSIKNIRLNVDVINEELAPLLPFVKFTEIRLTEMRVEVTSYTNLKRAPIVLVIEEIRAEAVEPLEYFFNENGGNKGARPQHMPQTAPPQAYGLLHRIIDNLSLRIDRITFSLQTLGKLKTRRYNPVWTPPPLKLQLENVEWFSVTETGDVGTPEQVWEHNDNIMMGWGNRGQRANANRARGCGHQHHHRSYVIYKKLSMLCHVHLGGEIMDVNNGKQRDDEDAQGFQRRLSSGQQPQHHLQQQQQHQQGQFSNEQSQQLQQQQQQQIYQQQLAQRQQLHQQQQQNMDFETQQQSRRQQHHHQHVQQQMQQQPRAHSKMPSNTSPSGSPTDSSPIPPRNLDKSPSSAISYPSCPLLSNTQIDIHVAYVRRLRDAAISGVDVDVFCPDVDFHFDVADVAGAVSGVDSSTFPNSSPQHSPRHSPTISSKLSIKQSFNQVPSLPSLPFATFKPFTKACDIGTFIHMLAGLQHCVYKDRSFDDPFLPSGVVWNEGELEMLAGVGKAALEKQPAKVSTPSLLSKSSVHSGKSSQKIQNLEPTQPLNHQEAKDGSEADDLGPDAFLPNVSLMEDELDSESSTEEEEPDEEHDEAFLAWKRSQQGKEEKNGKNQSSLDGQKQKSVGGEEQQKEQSNQSLESLGQEGNATIATAATTTTSASTATPTEALDSKKNKEMKLSDDTTATASAATTESVPTPKYKRKRRPVLVLASGAQKFERLSFSLSVQRIGVKLYLPDDLDQLDKDPRGFANVDNHPVNTVKSKSGNSESHNVNRYCLELLMEGILMEAIWPKESGEMGGHFQSSLSYLHLWESTYQCSVNVGQNVSPSSPSSSPPSPRRSHRAEKRRSQEAVDGSRRSSGSAWKISRISPLLKIGTRRFHGHDVFSMSFPWKKAWLQTKNGGSSGLPQSPTNRKSDEFPIMRERASIFQWDRPSLSGRRALALKSTISFVDEKITAWSKTFVNHEASLSELEIIFDSLPLQRLAKLASVPPHRRKLWWDERWFSGNWTADISMNIVVDPEEGFHLKRHIQPVPLLISNKNIYALSSDLRSVTTHMGPISCVIPRPFTSRHLYGMVDILFHIPESSVIVSSDLPKSFLSGKWINACDGENKDFPNDVSDISCEVITNRGNWSKIGSFRMQVSFNEFECQFVKGMRSAGAFGREGARVDYLIAPTTITAMLGVEHDTFPTRSSTSSFSSPACGINQSLYFSVLMHRLDLTLDVQSIHSALGTICASLGTWKESRLHSLLINPSSNGSDKNDSSAANCPSLPDITNCVICVHLPEIGVSLFGEHISPNKDERETLSPEDVRRILLCQFKLSQLECAVEIETHNYLDEVQNGLSPPGRTHTTIQKCGIGELAILVQGGFSKSEQKHKMSELISIGNEVRSDSLDYLDSFDCLENACKMFCQAQPTLMSRGIFLRSERMTQVGNVHKDEKKSTSTLSVEVVSPVILSLDNDVIGNFSNLIVKCVSTPVFVHSGATNSDGIQHGEKPSLSKSPVGNSLIMLVSDISNFFASDVSTSKEDEECNSQVADMSLTRVQFSRVLALLPTSEIGSNGRCIGFFCWDVAVTFGHCLSTSLHLGSDVDAHKSIAQKNCGRNFQTWKSLKDLQNKNPNAFYSLLSQQSVICMDRRKVLEGGAIAEIIPRFELNRRYSFPAESENASSNSVIEVFGSLIKIGMSLSGLLMLFYQPSEDLSDLSNTAQRFRDLVGNYHSTVLREFGERKSEVDDLRFAVFEKERERNGALSLVSSRASGWVRAGEGTSFSHRIFSSATLWRYWMVLNNLSMLILYESPGCVSPSFVVPLGAETQLRSVFISSSSSSANKSIGIVANTLRQRGFAVVEPSIGSELFVVSSNQADHDMWVEAISEALKKSQMHIQRGTSQDASNEEHANLESEEKAKQPVDEIELEKGDQGVVSIDSHERSTDNNVLLVESGSFHGEKTQESTPTESDSRDNVVLAPDSRNIDAYAFDLIDNIRDSEMETISLSERSSTIPPQNDSLSDTFSKPLEDPLHSLFEVQSHLKEPPLQAALPTVAPQQNFPATPQVRNDAKVGNQSQQMPFRNHTGKGKSRFATGGGAKSLLGSALKTAKAASEISRDGIKQGSQGIKQALAEQQTHHSSIPRGNPPRPPQASTGMPHKNSGADYQLRQKMSGLKKSANSKLSSFGAAVQSTVKEHTQHQEFTHLENRSNIGEPSSDRTTSNSDMGSSRSMQTGPLDDGSSSRSSKQGDQLRKKFANLDQSVSNTVRRFKIDEKMTQIGAVASAATAFTAAAVKNAANESQVMRQTSSASLQQTKTGDPQKTCIGIGEEKMKPIKFDARETFSVHSELPIKIKSLKYGAQIPVKLPENKKVFQKIGGSWAVSVASFDEQIENVIDYEGGCDDTDQIKHQWKFQITCTRICNDFEKDLQVTVQKRVSEVLIFHSLVSEILTRCLSFGEVITSKKESSNCKRNSEIIQNMSPMERLRVAGALLEKILETKILAQNCKLTMVNNMCNSIKVFVSMLLESSLPEEAIAATKSFLSMDSCRNSQINGHVDSSEINVTPEDLTLTSNETGIYEALDMVFKSALLLEGQIKGHCKQAHTSSSLCDIMMDGYMTSLCERDEALANLAAASIFHEHSILQEKMAARNPSASSGARLQSLKMNTDEDMLMLCKQLGNEISTRTAAELEANRLKECLQFERRQAKAREKSLLAEIEKYKTALGQQCGKPS